MFLFAMAVVFGLTGADMHKTGALDFHKDAPYVEFNKDKVVVEYTYPVGSKH